jgi:membrane-associated phospholipid phosphatase
MATSIAATATTLVSWQTASLVFFLYTLAIALRRWTPAGRRAAAVASVGLAGTALSVLLPYYAWLDDWALPPALLLIGYWSSGGLFVRPMPRAEALLMAGDRALGIPVTGVARVVAECLEAAYLSIYAVVGLAFALFMALAPQPSPDRFWTVVLVTDYVCFAMLPWVQTRPPRLLEVEAPWHSSVRALNLRLLGSTSIHVNTWPSGHAAEAAALALLLLGSPIGLVLGMSVLALAISAGAVLGRYHYALDAVAGWMVALTVWLLV